MMQSNSENSLAAVPSGFHVAIIMDGSGRWAERRGWPRLAGHRAGVEAVRRVVRSATEAGIGTLTLFAFSSANWSRPEAETAALMNIFTNYLQADFVEGGARGVQLNVIGRRARLPRGLLDTIEAAESASAGCRRMRMRLAIDYSAREAVAEAAARQRPGTDFSSVLAEVLHDRTPVPDLDLLIRTGGEKRLSDCLLWEGAFAEIIFTDRLWPDFSGADLMAAVQEFQHRERRFGGLRQAG